MLHFKRQKSRPKIVAKKTKNIRQKFLKICLILFNIFCILSYNTIVRADAKYGGAIVEENKSAEHIAFKLFLDAVKRKDKMQFVYYNLYSNITHSKENEFNETEELELT